MASGLLSPETVATLQGWGVKHFFAKPYTPQELLQLVRQVIDSESVEGPLAPHP